MLDNDLNDKGLEDVAAFKPFRFGFKIYRRAFSFRPQAASIH
jgi:hypothetical protein